MRVLRAKTSSICSAATNNNRCTFRKDKSKVPVSAQSDCLSPVSAFILGRYRALSEPRFIFDQDLSHYIMLRIYGDNIVAAPYQEQLSDHSNLIVGGGLLIFKVGDTDTPKFQNSLLHSRLSIYKSRLVGQDPWFDWAYPYE
jgi:hypothetical protein